MTVAARTMDELRRGRDAAATNADLIELRLDVVDQPSVEGALEGRRRPVVITCRPRWEGGGFAGSEEERERMLSQAVDAGAEFVDVEARAEFVPAILRRRRGRGIVLSMHAYGDVPRDLRDRARAMRSTGAEIVKLAIDPVRLTDTIELFELATSPELRGDVDGEATGHVLVAMGQPGFHTRVLAARLGNRWTYAGDGVVPGQVPAARLLDHFRFRAVRADAALYGVVGNPIAHSLSPPMHNAGFAALGINAVYVPLQAESADDFMTFARAMGLQGASVTAPFKVDMLSRVDEVDGVAGRVGALNTIAVRNGRSFGTNTDVDGFLAPLAGRIALRGTRATILGAGGAARAIAVALAQQGAAVTVCARRPDRAGEVAALAGGTVGQLPPRPGSWDVLVNATSSGGDGHDTNLMAAVTLDGEIVYDLVYTPADTPLLKQARAQGCMTIGGLEMLVAQAERQFEIWTGQRPPEGLFRDAAAKATGEAQRAPAV